MVKHRQVTHRPRQGTQELSCSEFRPYHRRSGNRRSGNYYFVNAQNWNSLVARLQPDWSGRELSVHFLSKEGLNSTPEETWERMHGTRGIRAMYLSARRLQPDERECPLQVRAPETLPDFVAAMLRRPSLRDPSIDGPVYSAEPAASFSPANRKQGSKKEHDRPMARRPAVDETQVAFP